MSLNKLTKLFNLYIKLKESDENGMCQCVTCGAVDNYKNMDAGHFITSKHLSTRFDEMNVHTQCRTCNGFKNGENEAYTRWMVGSYGQEEVDKLILKSHQLVKLDYENLIKIYTEKLKNLGYEIN